MSASLAAAAKGESSSFVVRPFAGQLITRHSPERPDFILQFKRCGVAEDIERQNASSKIRYIQEEGSDRIISERDFPMGSLQLTTIALSLADWNAVDEEGRPIRVNESTIKRFLTPREFKWAYRVSLEVNPSWAPGADDEGEDDYGADSLHPTTEG